MTYDNYFERHESNWDYLSKGRKHTGKLSECVEECL
jgi:hypothetical protein